MRLNGTARTVPAHVIFDLDGTLLDSSAEILKSLAAAYADAGLQVEDIRHRTDLIGPPVRGIIERITPGIDEAVAARIISCFRNRYDGAVDDVSTLYDGVAQLLGRLRAEGRGLYIATNKPLLPTRRVLGTLGIADLFDDIYTVDRDGLRLNKQQMIEAILKTHSIAPADCAMVGDSTDDLRAARACGVPALAAQWGYTPAAVLNEYADASAQSVCELSELLG